MVETGLRALSVGTTYNTLISLTTPWRQVASGPTRGFGRLGFGRFGAPISRSFGLDSVFGGPGVPITLFF